MTTLEASPEAAESESPPEAAPAPAPPAAWPGGVDHKRLAGGYIALALAALVAGGVLAGAMRTQLVAPALDLVGRGTYRELYTLHGAVAVFLFALPAWAGLTTGLVPLQVGATRLAFPRLNAMSLWLFVGGAVLVTASPFAGRGVSSGWTLSAPIPERGVARGSGPDLLILGMALVSVAVILVAVNLLVTALKLRAPGLTLSRLPLFTWSAVVSSSVLLLATPVLLGGLLLLFVDRHYGGQVFRGFTGSGGGNPQLWPRLFWFFAYPALWALLLSALGVVSEMVPVFARRRLVGQRLAGIAMAWIGVLAFAGWGSEVASISTRSRPVFALGALAVLAPTAGLLLTWLATARAARKGGGGGEASSRVPVAPVLHAAGLVTLVGLGLAAAAVSALGAGTRLHLSYWSVGHQHALFFGALVFGLAAALHYWAPKLWGRHLNDELGRLEFLLLLSGAHLTTLAMLVLGLQGMHRHLPTYPPSSGWQPANLVATAGGYLLALGVLLLVLNLLASVVGRRGKPAADDPWQGHTLEWATTSPPPPHNFDRLPEIRSDRPLLDVRDGGRVTG